MKEQESEELRVELSHSVQRLISLRNGWARCKEFGVRSQKVDEALAVIDSELASLAFWQSDLKEVQNAIN